MDTHDELEAVLNADEQVLSIVDVNVEFSFESVMNVDTGLNTDLIILRVPIGLIGDWNTVPSVWVHVSESFADASDDSLGKDMWLLLKMMMISIWIVEASHWHNRHVEFRHDYGLLLRSEQRLLVLQKDSFQHFYNKL